ncbi:beta-ketoacyl synthase N-terminal-like domain-containing protein [Leptothoe sp. LEGE 181152]|nr:beta-ketoacyl synthase N-terminal-like domain-containing protein [Leptothoe sp. LEGE 181152]
MLRDVVVTGIGIITSIGGDRDAFTRALQAGVCGITADVGDGLGVAGRISPLDFKERLAALKLPSSLYSRARRAGHRVPLAAQLSLLTALEASIQAFGLAEDMPLESASLIVSGNNISPGYQYQICEKFSQTLDFMPASYALHFLDTDHVGILSEVLGIKGEGCTVGGASASGNMGILQAWRQIRYGIANICLVVGAMTDLSPMELQAFRNAGALGGNRFKTNPEQACRPFDRDREGFIYGQGSACLILESADCAKTRGAEILGHIAGAATCLDAHRLSHPSVEGEARAMGLALEQANTSPEAVDYVNTHGTSSLIGDETEAKALKDVFGKHINSVGINATKGLTGHCLHAAGVVEAAATLVQMNQQFLHPNLNLRHPIASNYGFVGTTTQAADIEVGISNSFGFGGINTSLVIRRSR